MAGPSDRLPIDEQVATAGLLDVTDDRLDERRQLVSFLLEQGCSVEEMVAANSRGRLFGLAGDRILRPGGSQFTLAETAEHIGLDLRALERIWQAFGFRVPEPGEPSRPMSKRSFWRFHSLCP